MSEIFPNFTGLVCCNGNAGCYCGDEEIVIRNYIHKNPNLPEMIPAQRTWCISQAHYLGEGLYKTSELEAMTDYDLACAVMNAWREYAASRD